MFQILEILDLNNI